MRLSWPDLVDRSLLAGNLSAQEFYLPAGSGQNMEARVPGVSLSYRCSQGMGLADNTNPNQVTYFNF